MITKTDTQLSKALIDKKLIAPDDLKAVADDASKSKETLYALLLKSGKLSEDQLLSNLAEALKIPLVEADAIKAEPDVIAKVPLKIAEYYKIAPLRINKRKLMVAVSSPMDLRTQDDLRAHLGYEIETVLAREKDIAEALRKMYGFAAGTIGEIMAGSETPLSVAEPEAEKVENIEKLAGDASIAKLVNQIILEAYRKRASDIHIEPYRGKVKLRYRIDGVLYNQNVQPEMGRLILPVLSRVKIMSNLNIVEKRLPQDGRAIVKVEDTQLDLRVSSIPTPYGESVVIRMLPMNRIFDMKQLGLSPEQTKVFEQLIEKPHGIIFITGPTGSGKSTTLYASLKRINTDERKIITIEDPVEYEMEGITQIQIQPSIGLDFAKGLRSMLRHDPDVMMVGEVRDLETAEMAIRVALTGHLVFSTLHTNTAAGGITRLVDIGVPPYLVASSVEAFIAQRLVRVICPHCKEEDKSPAAAEIKKQIARDLRQKTAEKLQIFRGKGCNKCNGTGFWGRVAIYEILLIRDEIKELIMKRAPASDIHRAAIAQGMQTLKQDGWQKVLAGITTPEEILEVAIEGREEGVTDEPTGEEEPGPSTDSTPSAGSGRASSPRAGSGQGAERPAVTTDRRQFVRMGQSLSIGFRVVKLPGQSPSDSKAGVQETAVTRDVSAGGLKFAAKRPFTTGTILELAIELQDGPPPVECLARITRVEEAEEDKAYEIAVCFLDLTRAVRARLEKYVEKNR